MVSFKKRKSSKTNVWLQLIVLLTNFLTVVLTTGVKFCGDRRRGRSIALPLVPVRFSWLVGLDLFLGWARGDLEEADKMSQAMETKLLAYY